MTRNATSPLCTQDPFNLVQNNSAEKKARGLKSEILNGRAVRPPRPRPLLFTLRRGDGVLVG